MLKRELTRSDGVVVDLSAREFDLLVTFLEAPQTVLSREYLLDTARNRALEPFDRAIDMHLSNLRKKLPDRTDGQPRFKTVRGRGYLWLEQE